MESPNLISVQTEPVLSVCLASFNRAKKLRRTLTALSEQICALEQPGITLEVIVGDNHSEDETEDVLKEFCSKYEFVSYVRHDKNIGPTENYKAVIRQSRGNFIWLLSDDDYLLSGCIKKVLESLRDNADVHYVFLNYLLWAEDTQKVVGPSQCVAKADCRLTGIDQFFLETRFAGSFIGSNIFRKTTWDTVMEDWFFDTEWPQLYVSSKVANKFPVLIVAEPVLMMGCLPIEQSRTEKARQGNDQYYMDAHLQYLRFLRFWLPAMANSYARKLVGECVISNNLYQIEHYRTYSIRSRFSYLFSIFLEMSRFQPLAMSVSYWVKDVPVLLMPSAMFRCFSRYRRFRNELPGWYDSNDFMKKVAYGMYRGAKSAKHSLIGLLSRAS
jgi:glycosyltransferase involved in cell wall biosynthesis